jgi:hypothetical protein
MALIPNLLKAFRFMVEVMIEARAAYIASRRRYPGLSPE